MPNRAADLMIVDDDIVDIKALKRALKKAEILNPISTAKNGIEALEHLQGLGGIKDRLFLIILDLNMPKMNGHEFLEEIRKHGDLKDSVVFVFTTSDSPVDLRKAYQKNIVGYFVKNSGSDQYGKFAKLVGDYLTNVKLPA